MNPEERLEFEIYPDYDTPQWAKGAVMYQIFVYRFCNGDPTNDVEDREYFFIGDMTSRVRDWGKVPAVMGVREFYGGDLQGIMDKSQTPDAPPGSWKHPDNYNNRSPIRM